MAESIYDKNVKFLKENCPKVWEQIKEGDFTSEGYKVLPAKKEGLYFIEAENKKMLLHSRYDPLREARIWAETQNLSEIKHVILFGLGLGYHVEALIERQPDLFLYIYEPDRKIFFSTLEHRDWTLFPWERVYLVFEDGGESCDRFVWHVVNLTKKGWTFLSVPSFERCFGDQLRKLKEQFKKTRQAYVESLITNFSFEKEWTVNALRNLPFIMGSSSIFRFKEYFQGCTAVLTASGPSLNEAVPYLRKLKENRNALIAAAGTSVNGLLRHGLIPDMFVSYDPFPNNFKALKPALSESVPLVFGSTINSDVVKNHIGPKAYFILSQDTIFEYLQGGLDKREVIEDAPSIAVVALRLLDRLGVKEVVLAGQDLAFVGDRYYADGIGVIRSESVSNKEKEAAVEVESNCGGKVLTSRSFMRMKESMEQAVRVSNFERVINTSTYGAKIEGTKFMEWNEVMKDLSRRSWDASLIFKEPEPGVVAGLRKMRRKVGKILAEIEEDYVSVRSKAEEFLKLDSGADEAKKKCIFERLLNSVNLMTSQKKFSAFILPMVRNEVHLLKKSLGEIKSMSWEEKRSFVTEDLTRYLNGILASIIKLKEVLKEWDSVERGGSSG